VNALVAQGFFACLIVAFAKTFETIASLFVSTSWLFYAVSFAGLLLIQWRERGSDAGASKRFPFSTAAAVLFIVVTLCIIGSDLAFSGRGVLVGIGVVIAGVPAYHVWRTLTRRRVRA